MTMFYHRPVKIIKFSKDCFKSAIYKRRKPFDKREAKFTFIGRFNVVQCENSSNSVIQPEEHLNYGSNEEDTNPTCGDSSLKMEIEDASENNIIKCNIQKGKKIENALDSEKVEVQSESQIYQSVSFDSKHEKNLNAIIKKLSDRAYCGFSRLNHIRTSHQKHVSPRKRILREFEKVSLADLHATQKRCRPKTGILSSVNLELEGSLKENRNSIGLIQERSISPETPDSQRNNVQNQSSDTHTVTSLGTSSIPVLLFPQQKPTSSSLPVTTSAAPMVSQSRISSYSITSLLGHESSSSSSIAGNNHLKNDTNCRVNSFVDNMSSPVRPPSTDSRYSFVCTSSNNKKRSPSYGTSSPLNNVANNLHGLEYFTVMRSPDLSPSPEHQIHHSGFPRYRSPSTLSMMHVSSSAPQTRQTPIRSSSSPSNSDSYTTKCKSSYMSELPNNHPYASVSPSHRYSPINGYQSKTSPVILNKLTIQSPTKNPTTSRHSAPINTSPNVSPTIEDPVKVKKELLPLIGVRNLPKKTYALRQQFQQSNNPLPSSDPINPISVRGYLFQKEREKNEVDHRSYPSIVHSGMPGIDPLGSLPIHRSYTAAASSMYQYMFPPGPASHNSYLSSYYQQVYATAAIYRNPFWMHYPAAITGPQTPSHLSMSEHLGAPHSSTWLNSEHSPSSRPLNLLDEDDVSGKEEFKELNPGKSY